MIEAFYRLLALAGYTHPLHPVAVHLPAGCIAAALIFALIGWSARKPAYYQSARHCMGLALFFLPLAALLGYMDWQHYYAGVWILPFQIKVGLAGILLILLISAVRMRVKARPTGVTIIVYLFCLALVAGLGYFGGELVYGSQNSTKTELQISELAQKGQTLYEQKCAFCHFSDKIDSKVGPGLKGLLQREKLVLSNWPMTEANLRKQIKTPFDSMPAFENLSDEEMDALMAYLKKL